MLALIFLTFSQLFSENTRATEKISPPVCRFALTTPGVWNGTLETKLSNDEQDVYFLGSGILGSRVYRLVPKDGSPPQIRKVYKHKYEARRDYVSLKILEDAINNGLNGGRHIRGAKVLGIEQNVLFLEDVRGTNLKDLYDKKVEGRNYWDRLWIGLNIVAAATVDYSRNPSNREKFRLEFPNQIPRPEDMRKGAVEGEAPELPELIVYYEVKEGRLWLRRSIFLHAENIIMEPDGMMVIVDPS